MSFVKAFLISLAVFIGLNVIFFIIGNLVNGTLVGFFAILVTNPENIIIMLFGPIFSQMGPEGVLSAIYGAIVTETVPLLGSIIYLTGYIVAPLIAAFLSGRFGENKKESFGGWFTSAIISAIVVLLVVIISSVLSAPLLIGAIVLYLVLGLIFGIFYGCFALLISRSD